MVIKSVSSPRCPGTEDSSAQDEQRPRGRQDRHPGSRHGPAPAARPDDRAGIAGLPWGQPLVAVAGLPTEQPSSSRRGRVYVLSPSRPHREPVQQPSPTSSSAKKLPEPEPHTQLRVRGQPVLPHEAVAALRRQGRRRRRAGGVVVPPPCGQRVHRPHRRRRRRRRHLPVRRMLRHALLSHLRGSID